MYYGRRGSFSSNAAFSPSAVHVFVNAEASAYVAAMTVPPNNARKIVIDALFTALKNGPNAGTNLLSTKCDALCLLAAHDSQAARINLKTATVIASAVNGGTGAPSFVADRGFTTNGTDNYIDTGFNPVGAGIYTQNSATFGFWQRTNSVTGTSRAGWFDGTDGVTIGVNGSSGGAAYRINQATASNSAASAAPDPTRWFVVDRSGASGSGSNRLYRDGASVFTSAAASAAINNHNLYLGSASAGSFVAGEWAVFWAGGALSVQQHQDLYAALNAYKTAVGF